LSFCEKTFKDVISGACKNRPGLDEALNYCRPGDTFVVWELERLGRSLKHLIDVVEGLKAKDVNFRVLKDGISTDTIGEELTFHIFGALAEYACNFHLVRDLLGSPVRVTSSNPKDFHVISA